MQLARSAKRLPIFPPDDPDDEISLQGIRLPAWLWRRLDEIAAMEAKAKKKKVSRNAVVAFFLEWASDDYLALHGDKDKKGKK